MRSMYSGVSGLRIHQTKMDVIGNNIANVNTVGFKSSRVTFSEVFSQTIQSASGANENTGGKNPMQIGLGANIASIDVNMTEGAAQRTDNPLDLKIEGEGFFVVSDATGNKFTRAGAFRIDEAGNLVTPEGLNLMGWKVNQTTGEIEKSTVKPLQALNPSNMYAEPAMTTEATFSGNINKNDTQIYPGNGGRPFTTTIYDSLGYKYTANFNVEMGVDGASNPDPKTYNFTLDSVTDENGNDILIGGEALDGSSGAGNPARVIFDTANGKVDTSAAAIAAGGQTALTLSGLSTAFSTFSPINIDISGLTLFSGNTTIEGYAGDVDGIGSGNQAGAISGFEVGGDGKVLGRYSNGETKLLGQIAVATFKNPAGLQKIGNNLFEATNNSGEFDGIGEDISSTGGSFNAGVLEMSNVDLSREFTEMITTQRGFQANSRIITSSDEMLQELVNLKR